MRIAITGTTGLFGRGLVQALREKHEVLAIPHTELDLTDSPAVSARLSEEHFDLLIHPAGIPDIDLCELEPQKCHEVNVAATRNLCELARAMDFGVAFISTDAVFDGTKTSPYLETDATNPPTVYGRCKLEAEKLVAGVPRHWIFRVSVLFGPGKTNFVERCIRNLQKGEPYVCASDQWGSATYTLDAARTLIQVCETAPIGLYHLSNSGPCSRYELALQAARFAELDPSLVVGQPLAELRRPAPRLKYSVMEMAALKRAQIPAPRPWQEALREYVDSLL